MWPAYINQIFQQWPSLAAVAVLGIVVWRIFQKFLEENNKMLLSYKELSDTQGKDLERYRAILMNLFDEHRNIMDENQNTSRKYEETRQKLTEVMIEYDNLMRIAEQLEEMIRAMGGDMKVISINLATFRNDMKDASDQIFRIESASKTT